MGDTAVSCSATDPAGNAATGGFTVTVESSPAVATGSQHTCALLSDSTVHCWGANDHGQLGTGTTVGSTRPVAAAGLSGVAWITAGGNHTCALLGDGTVHCWGANQSGELGNGTNIDSNMPVTVAGLSAVTAITSGGGHACAFSATAPSAAGAPTSPASSATAPPPT